MYRSIRDTGEFEVENEKTILVGPNEAGKTVILHALQQLKQPKDIGGFDALRDYPRSEYDDIKRGVVDPAKVTVVERNKFGVKIWGQVLQSYHLL
jgi:predicted ATP-binding protein involved in virulence